ncbi:hypothetical protein, partial [Aquicoccus sp.]|uniref:hypothetical protein n=1 Tax=Aquicoccus sp. TaxID=2055851 RepID=UPI0035674811
GHGEYAKWCGVRAPTFGKAWVLIRTPQRATNVGIVVHARGAFKTHVSARNGPFVDGLKTESSKIILESIQFRHKTVFLPC